MNSPTVDRLPTTDYRPPASVFPSPASRPDPVATRHPLPSFRSRSPSGSRILRTFPPSPLSPPSFHRPPITDHRLRTTDHRRPPSGLRPLASGARASRGAAFTLIELLVATAITSILILGMTGIFDQSMKAWRLSSRRADAEREVRAALSQIERDLSCLVVNSNTPIYLNIAATNRVSIPNPFRLNMPPNSGPQGQDWVNVSQTLFFAAADRSRTNQQGDLASVGYFVAWDTNSNGTNGAWNFYRRYQRPADLYTALLARVALPNLSASSVGPYHLNSLPAPELLAANVLNFWVQFVMIRTNGTAVTLPTNPVSGLFDFPSLVSGTWITKRPHYAQLELTAYSGDQVRSFSGGTLATRRQMWSDTSNIAKFGRTFVWRVDL